MCESCRLVLATQRLDLGQSGPPFHVCDHCAPSRLPQLAPVSVR